MFDSVYIQLFFETPCWFRSRHNLRSSGRGATTKEENLVTTITRKAPAKVMISLLVECEGGERGDLSPGDFLTGVWWWWWVPHSSTDQPWAGGVVVPALLHVLDRAGVATVRVVQLHFLMRVTMKSSRYYKTWKNSLTCLIKNSYL